MTAEAVAAPPQARIKPRRVWLALVLALMAPAAAYLYVGRPRRALAAALGWAAFFLVFRHGLGGWIAEPAGFAAVIAVAIGALVFVAGDVARIAWGARAYRLRGYNRVWIYVLVWLFADAGAEVIVDPDLGGFPAMRTFAAVSTSMAPTLEIGDKMVADMRAYERTAPAPGDVAVIDRNGDGSELWIKRVIAGPGDAVAIVHGVVEVNDAPVRLDPVGLDSSAERAIETLANGTSHVILPSRSDFEKINEMGRVVVPAESYFVLGDNRGNSVDSRFPEIGFVPRAHMAGRITFLYWSRDRKRIGARVP